MPRNPITTAFVPVAKGGTGTRTHDGPAYRPKVTGAPWLELTGPEPDGVACVQCGSATATVYLIRDPRRGVPCKPLHEQCARFFFPHAEGLSERTIDALASWYEQSHCDRRDEPETATRLGRELRHRLRHEFDVLPEFIEVEAARVTDRVFSRT